MNGCRIGRIACLSALLLAVMVGAGAAHARGRAVTVVTSFPSSLYEPVRKAFEAANPDLRLRFMQKKTSAAIAHIRTRGDDPADLFWASAPDSFELLKEEGLLAPIGPRKGRRLPDIGGVPIDDPDGTYLGFALSGYGLLWSDAYLRRHGLPVPRSWDELRDPVFDRHIGMSAPSRSGTTHLMVESSLQYYGWEKGWAMWMEIAGNLATVTARSFGVAEGVENGRFGIGLAIDFFTALPADVDALSFTHPLESPFLPASIAVLTGASEPAGAHRFVDFLLSPEGQRLMMRPEIRRLPVLPELYAEAPTGMPNPFRDERHETGRPAPFDRGLSALRYELINLLFDELITYRSAELHRLWTRIRDCERRLAERPNADAARLLAEARQTLGAVPVDEKQSRDAAFNAGLRRSPRGVAAAPRQAALEKQWREFAHAGAAHTMRLIGRACPAGAFASDGDPRP